jgi:hypothetical protein
MQLGTTSSDPRAHSVWHPSVLRQHHSPTSPTRQPFFDCVFRTVVNRRCLGPTEFSRPSITATLLAQVDGARRDLLETITHGPRGNIINVYTTFPWPALCAEVAKLKIEKVPAGVTKTGSQNRPRRRPSLYGDARSLATGLATAQRNWRNRWRKGATPAGFELEDG